MAMRSDMLDQIIDDFRAARTWGVKVLVLPAGREAVESDLLAAFLGRPAEPAAMIVGVSPAKVLPLHSVRDAIVGGYRVSKGMPGLLAAAVGTRSEMIGEMVGGLTSGVFGWLTKATLHKLTDTPVSRLSKPPYTPDDVAASLRACL